MCVEGGGYCGWVEVGIRCECLVVYICACACSPGVVSRRLQTSKVSTIWCSAAATAAAAASAAATVRSAQHTFQVAVTLVAMMRSRTSGSSVY